MCLNEHIEEAVDMNNQILEIFSKTKIDFTKTIVEISGGGGGVEYFEIKPRDFIRFAKEDLKSNNDSGLINAITNAKRAIDCQIDTILQTFGIKFDDLPIATEIFINHINENKSDLPQKLKLIQSLQIAPGSLTSNARTLRNKLEHYYKKPKLKEIEDAIEIAELFVLSCESKTKLLEYDYSISNEVYENNKEDFEKSYVRFKTSLDFYYDEAKKNFTIASRIENKITEDVSINSTMPEYYFLMRMLNTLGYTLDFNESLSYLLSYINHPIPKNKIKIAEMNN